MHFKPLLKYVLPDEEHYIRRRFIKSSNIISEKFKDEMGGAWEK
jgi:hypothetical protein